MGSLHRGQVALVTGASVGIGRSVAAALAARGLDVVAVARDEDRLRDLAATLEERHGTRAEVLVADLTDAAGLARVERRVEEGVDLLVNNAGFGSSGRFWELDLEREVDQVALNVTALVRLTHAALRTMVPRGSGGVVNVSSVVSFQAVPDHATYTGTKAFVTLFSESVNEELRGTGVTLTCVCPGFTRTEFQARAGLGTGPRLVPGFAWQTADEVAAAALAGFERGQCLVVPGRHNQAAVLASALTPRSVLRRTIGMAARRL